MPDATSPDDLGAQATVDAAASGELGALPTVRAETGRPGGEDAILAPGAVVADQYRVERELGAGGMGVVFLARDERLGREVAIKVGTVVSQDGLRRIEREAQALAQLSHPNVVVVHQVGELGGRVFIVMEHVAGGTARGWLADAPRDWRAVVDLYLAAGDGLAAAHAAGLVHRDFKPDNVLVGPDGRPRVADFGLVQTADDAPEPGAVVGTPAYMPPEQLDAVELDARADQFAFCASLWEALFGARPFEGHTPAEVRSSIESAAPRREPGRRGAPRAIAEVLRRGLAARKEDRWPDVKALLGALRRVRDRRRRRAIAAVASIALGAAFAAAFALARGGGAEVCRDGPRQIAAVWDAARAARLTARLHADDGPRVVARVDDYARRWAVGHREACRATRVDRSQSEAMLDLRNVCLARLAGRLDATLGALERATPEQLLRADELLAQLPDVDRCAAVEALGTEEPPPSDPGARAALQTAIEAVARAAAATVEWADPEAARDLAERAVEHARAAGWRPELARALAVLGEIRYQQRDADGAAVALREAADLAMASRSDETAAGALAGLARSLSWLLRDGEARLALQLAQAITDRLADREVATGIAQARVHVELDAERFDAAIAAARHVIDLVADGPPLDRALAHRRLATVFEVARRPREVLEHAGAALALLEEVFGEDHPQVARSLAQRAVASVALDDLAAAAADLDRALAIYARRFGPESAPAASLINLLGEIARRRGDAAGARAAYARALAIAERDPRELEQQAFLLTNLGVLDLEAGDHAAGLARLDRALPLMQQLVGADGALLVDLYVARGYALRGLDHHDRARADLERAVAISARGYGALHPSTVNAQIELGNTLVAAGDAAGAMRLLAPLVGAVEADAGPRPPYQAIELRLALAAAHWAAGERASARRIAAEAARAAGDAEPGRSMAAAWQAEHR